MAPPALLPIRHKFGTHLTPRTPAPSLPCQVNYISNRHISRQQQMRSRCPAPASLAASLPLGLDLPEEEEDLLPSLLLLLLLLLPSMAFSLVFVPP